ncbi:MAG TPA: DUF429 domain-containing protein [Ilumatobacteraceae bacterium]
MTIRPAANCAGVDGCATGWVVATRRGVVVIEHISAILGGAHDVIAIDIPIGLPSGEERLCEREARRYLSPRGSTIFPTPPRACLGARDYADACARSLAVCGKKLSQQTWRIVPKIGEVDDALAAADASRVIEVHPECAFAAMNGDVPLVTKHGSAGLAARAALIEHEFGPIIARVAGAKHDDVLDAYAALWSAERFARGDHRVMPATTTQVDQRGLPMRIIF